MDISGAAEIPVTRLFGRSPSGLNATGESDLQNYYDMIAEKQESVLRPILNKLLPVFVLSTLGSIPEDFDFEFDPVAEPTDKERADLAKCGTDNVVAAYNAGLISQRTALQELKQQSERTGVWTNITDEDIERASDTVETPGEMGGMFGGEEPLGPQARAPVRQVKNADTAFMGEADDWDESKHERGGNPKNTGWFSKTGNGSSIKNNLQTQSNNANISATAEQKASFRKALIGLKTSCGATITGVSTHACDRMVQRGLSAEDVKVALRLANPKKSIRHLGTYEYKMNGRLVGVGRDGNIVTVYWDSRIAWR